MAYCIAKSIEIQRISNLRKEWLFAKVNFFAVF